MIIKNAEAAAWANGTHRVTVQLRDVLQVRQGTIRKTLVSNDETMTPLDYVSCLRFVEQQYFGNVRRGNLDTVMACFTVGAKVIIRHGDNPERVFIAGSTGEASELREFYEHLCSNYDAWFGDFQHVIDTRQQRSACYFTVKLTPKPEGLYASAGTQELHNCNFFEYQDGLIGHMIIYYSNSLAGEAGRPTGYPK
jgi:hypothetical protein